MVNSIDANRLDLNDGNSLTIEKKKRNRLSKRDENKLLNRAIELLNYGYSVNATAIALSIKPAKIFSLAIKNHQVDKLGQQKSTIYFLEELGNVLKSFNGFDMLVEIKEENGGVFIKPYNHIDQKGE